MSLKTDYKDDIFEGSRLWRIVQNDDGTCTITDATTYTQKGDKFGQNDINATNTAINNLDATVTGIITVALPVAGWSAAPGLYKQTVAVEGITAEDMPLLLKYTAPDASKDDSLDYGIDFALISGGQCAAGSVTFYATDTPDHDLTVALGLGKKGDGRLLMGGGGSGEKQQISNVVMTITDNAAVAEGGVVTAECNGKSWTSTIKNGKAKLYASEVGNYTITVVTTDAEPITYTTMLVCPYFGQFSTDIYSGTLMVTCTEEGGNGKSCNVRSCDDEYNATDAYNLTQTFDTGLELTFLGIPSGKYLVTVDDKYVFFKEIQSIQNINSANVELKQWLYNHGDQCPWNTGGWRACISDKTDGVSGGPASVATLGFEFAVDKIIYRFKLSASISVEQQGYCRRSAIKGNLAFGTVKPLIKDISMYRKLMMPADTGLTASFRVGNANNSETSINTPTILQSAPSNNMDIEIGSNNPYLVIGALKDYASYEGFANPGVISIDLSSNITEIWLE